MYKLDLHTHSVLSPDGGLKMEDYERVFKTGLLDFVAITDHNEIDFALQAKQRFGKQIIVGEEIMTKDGEVIGLYLKTRIKPGLSARKTIQLIKEQNAVVYIPHPFEKLRSGISRSTLNELANKVEIIEAFNGRAVQKLQASNWANVHKKVAAASSDAHGRKGWGRSFTIVAQEPKRENLVELLRSGQLNKRGVGLAGRLYPKYNRIKKLT